jgi:hypothetical protein
MHSPLHARDEYYRSRAFCPHPNARRVGSPGSLGNKPLAVITAPKQAEPGWLKQQDKLATLSSKSIHRVVKEATHTSLLYDRREAQASSAAIVEVVAAVRNDRPLALKPLNPCI